MAKRPFTEEEHSRALAEFRTTYGMAMEAWGRLEGVLFDWFMGATGIEERLARAIYFSAKSFNARRDMLQSALPFSSLDEPTKTFLKAALKKAAQFSSFRNAITHGEPKWHPKRFAYVLAEGSRESRPAPDDAVTIEQIKMGYLNFFELYRVLRDLRRPLFAITPDDPGPPSLEACLARVHALPQEAYSKQSLQSLPKKKRQSRKPRASPESS
jgi:hypothetical protein